MVELGRGVGVAAWLETTEEVVLLVGAAEEEGDEDVDEVFVLFEL
jgi:hypothetical protein